MKIHYSNDTAPGMLRMLTTLCDLWVRVGLQQGMARFFGSVEHIEHKNIGILKTK